MKHSEFKRRLEDLGFEVIDMSAYLRITKENGEVAWVSKNYEAVMDTNASIALNPEVRAKLFDILVEYAKTPIEDRKDEVKYFIYPIYTKYDKLVRYNATFRDFGYAHDGSFGIAKSGFCSELTTTEFLEEEAREICDFFGWDFDKVAVEVCNER